MDQEAQEQQTPPERPVESGIQNTHYQQPVSPPDLNIQPEKKSKTKMLIVISIVVLLLAAGGVGYFLLIKNSVEPTKENESVESTSTDAKPESTEQKTQISYSAEVGKFTLTLPSDYAIIKNHDGPGEGSKVTNLSIGKQLGTGVIENETTTEIKINAIPIVSADGSTFDGYVASVLGQDQIISQSDTNFAGVTARVYVLDGLNENKRLFFSNNDIAYNIHLASNTEESNKILELIKAGFKFN